MSQSAAIKDKSYKVATYVNGKLDVLGPNNPDRIIGYRSNVEEKGSGNMTPITVKDLAKKQAKQIKEFEGK
jgi:hypothetical protein